MSKVIKENYLSRDNGCRVIEVSSERQGSTASNILTSNERELWIVQKKLPQYCIINTSSLENYPKVFNRVGFFCWHQYESNPSLIQLSYNNGIDEQWIIAGKIRLELKSQYQSFKIKEIPVTEMKQLKITLLQNFGDKYTYLNQVQLGYFKENSGTDVSRQRTVSQFIKLTSTEKQLKKAEEQIKKLSSENEQIKKTLKRQGQLIIQMQNALKIVTKQIQKLHKMQQIQIKKPIIQKQERDVDKLILNNKSKRKVPKQSESQLQSDGQKQDPDLARYRKHNETLQSRTNNQSYTKSQRNSNRKYQLQNYEHAKRNATIRHSKQEKSHKSKSDSELSEYLVSQGDDQKSKYSQKCSQMMAKLQILLAEREKRNRELRQRNR